MSDALSYEEYLATHDTLVYANVGTSMMPLLREGRDLFIVVPKSAERCHVGDVVLYRRPPSHYVLHRVVATIPGGYLTIGDNSLARERVAEGDVIGVMAGFVRGGRTRNKRTRNGRAREGRTHSVDERGYRAYVRLVLLTERPRVLTKRLAAALKRRAKGLSHGR